MTDQAMTVPANDAASIVYANLPVRFSHLRAYGRSPMHGQFARTQDALQTRDMQRGTAVHALVFGNRPVVGYPGSQRRGKEYDAFAADNPGAEILTMSEYEKARRMADAINANDLARPLLAGINETTLRFDWQGMPCRATPDVRGLDYITELKTSSTVDPQRFLWHALRMHYHAQLYWYGLAAEICGYPIKRFYIVACEASEPFPVTVFEVQPRALDAAAKTIALWFERMKVSEASMQFPPYAQSVVPLDIPEDDDVDFVYPEEDEAA